MGSDNSWDGLPEELKEAFLNEIGELESEVETGSALIESYIRLGNNYKLVPGNEKKLKNLYKRAIYLLEQDLKAGIKNSTIYVSLAKIYMLDNKCNLACENYKKALELDPNSADILTEMARRYVSFGINVATAIEYATRAIELEPDNYKAYNVRAHLKNVYLNDFSAAMEDSKKSLELLPEGNFEAEINLKLIEGNMSKSGPEFGRSLSKTNSKWVAFIEKIATVIIWIGAVIYILFVVYSVIK